MMRATVWRKHISFLITIIMLFAGMCFDTVEADSSFSSESFPFSSENTAYTMPSNLENQEILFEDQTLDTYECENCLEENVRITQTARHKSTGIAVIPTTDPPETFLSFHKTAHIHSDRHSSAVIIGYVHSQDGSKS